MMQGKLLKLQSLTFLICKMGLLPVPTTEGVCKDRTRWWISNAWCVKLSQHCQSALSSVQFSSVTQSCPTLCDPMDCSMPGLPVHYQLPELTQTHVHWINDAIKPSHFLLSPSLSAFNLSQHQGIFQWVSSLHQVAQVLEFQLQPQPFRWIFRIDFI